MKDIQDQVRDRLQHTIEKYKEHADKKRRDLKFKVGDMVMIHLKKERLPKGQYTKLMMKKVGPFKILKKCGKNSYKIHLPLDIGLSPIFNIYDIYAYKPLTNDFDARTGHSNHVDVSHLPKITKPQIECILDMRVSKQNRSGTYYSYLVKWKDTPTEDATWMSQEDIKKVGYKLDAIPTQGT